jgi:tetratricopeptide (TPR) repeat protein
MDLFRWHWVRDPELAEAVRAVLAAADPDAFRAQVRAAFERKDRDEVVRLARDAVPQELPVATLRQLYIGLTLVGEDERARSLLRRMTRLHPNDPEILLTRCFSHTSRAEHDDAVRFGIAAVASSPTAAAATSTRVANILLQSDQEAAAARWLEGAEDHARRLVEQEPDRAHGWALLGLNLTNVGRWEEAIDALERATSLDPDDKTFAIKLAEVLRMDDDWSGAHAVLEKACRTNSHHGLRQRLGDLYWYRADFEKAIEQYRLAAASLAQDRRDGVEHQQHCYSRIAYWLSTAGEEADAAKVAEAWVEKWPESGSALLWLGVYQCEAGRTEDGLASIRRSAKLLPPASRPMAYHTLAHQLIAVDREGEAVKAYQRVASFFGRCVHCMRCRARVLESKGEAQMAWPLYVQAHEILLANQRQIVERLRPVREFRSDEKRDNWWVTKGLQALERRESVLREREMLVAAVRKVAPKLRRGETAFDSAEEYFAAGKLEWNRQRFAAGYRFTREALARDPALGDDSADGILSTSARLACRAASGLGSDAGELSADERSKMRLQAIAWLRRALDGYKAKTARERAAHLRRAARNDLVSWMSPGRWATNRFPLPGEMEDLPADERAEWESLWKDVKAFVESTWKGGRP